MKSNKVNFILLGAPKCATTTIASILSRHNEIGFCETKEPNFFSEEKNWKNNIEKYHSKFNFEEKKKVYGEASTTYSFYPKYNLNIAEDIYAYNSEMKFIYIVRDPYDRTFSQYRHWIDRGYTSFSFAESIISHPEIIFTSMYYMQIIPFFKRFEKNQILVLTFEEFIRNKTKFLEKTAEFLDINFEGFVNFDDVFENRAIDGGKKHYKYDKFKSIFEFTRMFFPKKTLSLVWDAVTKTKKLVEKNSNELSKIEKDLIYNLLSSDLRQFKELTGINYFE